MRAKTLRDHPRDRRVSEIVPPSADAVTGRAEQQGDEAEDEDDEPGRPDDPDLGHDADDEQDDSDGNHDVAALAGACPEAVLERWPAAISWRMSGGMVRAEARHVEARPEPAVEPRAE
jgi:hypothetical protein